MAYNNGKITAPVSIADVQRAVGSPSGDLGRLCRSANINMWAKFKPVSKGIINIMDQLNTDKTWKADSALSDPWWTGLSHNYGLGFTRHPITTASSSVSDALTRLAATIDGNMNGWSYSKPAGGSSTPFRLTDFNGYNMKAPRPVQGMGHNIDSVTATSTSPWDYTLQYRESDRTKPISDRDYLIPEDIYGGTLYTGVAIFKKNANNQYEAMAWTTGATWMGKGVANSTYSDGIINSTTEYDEARFKDGGTYYIIPVIFSADLAQTKEGRSVKPTSNAYVMTYPNTSFVEFTAHQAATLQNIGWPHLLSSNVLPDLTDPTKGYIAPRVYLDSTTSKYNGYYIGGTTTIGIAIVNNTWNGYFGGWIAGQYAGVPIENMSVTVPADTDYRVADISRVTLNLSYQWYVVIYFYDFDELFKITLRMPPMPEV